MNVKAFKPMPWRSKKKCIKKTLLIVRFRKKGIVVLAVQVMCSRQLTLPRRPNITTLRDKFGQSLTPNGLG